MDNYEGFLRKAVRDWKYINADATKREVGEVLRFFKGLKPVTEDFVFGNGQMKKLIALKGTIPINYRGGTYHIPVEIWLLDTHPNNAPLVYVRPTSNMRIKPSRNVDNSGKVYLPFLHNWKSDSGLMPLIQVLICTFEEQPPVFAVPTQPIAQPMMPPTPPMPTNVPYPVQQTSYSMPYPGSSYPAAMPMPALPNMPQMPTQNQSMLTVSPAHIRASLLSAGGEKLTRRLEDIYFSTQIEIKTGDQLKEGTTKLEEMVQHLNDEQGSVERTITSCENEIQQLDEKILKLSNDETQMIVDDAIQAPTPLYKQIVNAFVEEAAVEDTIYYLSEGFRDGKLDFEHFQKHLRVLSRKQFMLRAILRKCRQKAGLAG